MNSKLILFVSCLAAVTLSASAVNAAPHGHGGHGRHSGYHGKHGKQFSRGGPKFSRNRAVAYRNWSGRKWSGRNWNGGYWGGGYWNGGSRFIFIGGLGYPYNSGWYPYWGWRYPYSYSYYSYYPYWYYPSYGYKYDDCSISRRRFFGP